MDTRNYTERDWKLFRKKIDGWQERFIARLLKDYISLLQEDEVPSERFWELNRRIREDKRLAGVSVEMRRSALVRNMAALLTEGAITYKDLDGFSGNIKRAMIILVGDTIAGYDNLEF